MTSKYVGTQRWDGPIVVHARPHSSRVGVDTTLCGKDAEDIEGRPRRFGKIPEDRLRGLSCSTTGSLEIPTVGPGSNGRIRS